MLKLIKLEMKKFKMGGYVRSSLITNVIILGVICLISYVENLEGAIVFEDYAVALQLIETIIRATYIIFAAVLISRLVINEYKNKSITVLFMYPINRKSLIIAKLLIVVIFTFVNIVAANIFVGGGFYLVDQFAQIVPDQLTLSGLGKHSASVVMNALSASCMSLIPLYFGMRKFSGSTTIISSIFIVLIVCQNMNGFTLNSIVFVPITLAVIGAIIAYLAIRNIENKDVIH
ncbi:ABC transporter permease [Cytobacillus praedii]|uniref:ABC transporter permease n=1 Tax=Cytobacillus praedii TaxID=1742358 RepID=UPI002E223F55|nr:ABC transporter permease [Cytobacillus praedii]